MSLEAKLEQTNQLLSQIITILNSGVAANTEIAPAETTAKRGPGRPKKTEVSVEIVYWSIPSLNSVFAQEPGMAAPTAPDAVKITAEEYAAKKQEISQRVDAVLAAQAQKASAQAQGSDASSSRTAEAAAVAAPEKTASASAPSAQSAATAAQASTAAGDVPFSAVMESAKAVNSSQAPGCGREGLMAVLKKFLPDDPQPTVTKLQPLGRNAEVKAAFDALLAPKAADFDPLA